MYWQTRLLDRNPGQDAQYTIQTVALSLGVTVPDP